MQEADDDTDERVNAAVFRNGGSIMIAAAAGAGTCPADSLSRNDPAAGAPYGLVFGIGLPVDPGDGDAGGLTIGAVERLFQPCLTLCPDGAVFVWGEMRCAIPRSKRKRIRKKWAYSERYVLHDVELWAALRAFLVECFRQGHDYADFDIQRLSYVTGGGWHGGTPGSICLGNALRFDGDGKTRVRTGACWREVDAEGAYRALRRWVFGADR